MSLFVPGTMIVNDHGCSVAFMYHVRDGAPSLDKFIVQSGQHMMVVASGQGSLHDRLDVRWVIFLIAAEFGSSMLSPPVLIDKCMLVF